MINRLYALFFNGLHHFRNYLILSSLLLPGRSLPAQQTTDRPGSAAVETVIVLGIDGLNTYRFDDAITPNFEYLQRNGSWTYTAHCNQPASSSPNWSSIIRGTTPDKHLNTQNGFKQNGYPKAPTCPSEPKYFPTIFTLISRQRPKAKTGLFEHWGGFRWLVRKDKISRKIWREWAPHKVLRKAIRYYEHKAPALVFIHLDLMDHAGHKYGHESPEYALELQETDQYLGELIKAIYKQDQFEKTSLIVVADHGGKGNSHGGTDPAVVNIPWMIMGPGIRKGHEIRQQVNNEDTALMIATLLGLNIHECWTGKVVEEVFEQ